MQKGKLLISSKQLMNLVAKSNINSSTKPPNSSAATGAFDGEASMLYSKLAEQHRHKNGPWNMMLEKIKSLNLPLNSKVVDVASGPGEPACTIASNITSITVFSTDVAPAMHKIAACKAINIPNLKAMISDAEDLSAFDNDSIDVVTCCYGYMFPEDKEKALREAYRILKPRGVLIATYWRELSMMELMGDIMTAVLKKQPPTPTSDPLSLRESGLFENIVKNAGFKGSSEYINNRYPFDLGANPELQYKMATFFVKSTLDELDAHTVARKAFDENIQKYSEIDTTTGTRVVGNNVFTMATLVK